MNHATRLAARTLVGAGLLLAAQAALACGSNCPPTGKIGDFVWEDCNGDGIQNDEGLCAGGAGIPDLVVTLRKPNDGGYCYPPGELLAQETTNRDGLYLFRTLPQGDYCIDFPNWGELPECPDGTSPRYTTKNAPGSTHKTDSDPWSNSLTSVIYLPEGKHDLTIDAGVLCKASIGDTLWNDLDRDGIQDDLNGSGPDSEPGINGVTVTLFECDGTQVGSSTTTADQDGDPNRPGWYQFDGLVPGCYLVQFATPDGFVFSPANQGGDPELDSNVNPSGATGEVNLVSGESNQTIDAGVNRPATAGHGKSVLRGLSKLRT